MAFSLGCSVISPKPARVDGFANQDENALRSDLEHLARLNRTFGGRKAVETVFHKLADKTRSLLLIDLAAGYGDHGRNLLGLANATSMR